MTNHSQHRLPIVLTIAGFDPSGGAGVIADIRTIEALGCKAVAAITSITFQNAKTYVGALNQRATSVRAQVEAILAEHEIVALKIGMLPTPEIVHEVARLMLEFALPPPVIDPVMESTSGGKLMDEDAFELFVTRLLPVARLITPNIPEAEKLAGLNIRDEDAMRRAAGRIRELGARAVLVKGGHLKVKRSDVRGQRSGQETRTATDLLDDHGEVTVFQSDWIDTPDVRGTGCVLSSAIACGLARGVELKKAIKAAREFISQVIQNSKLETPNSKLSATRS